MTLIFCPGSDLRTSGWPSVQVALASVQYCTWNMNVNTVNWNRRSVQTEEKERNAYSFGSFVKREERKMDSIAWFLHFILWITFRHCSLSCFRFTDWRRGTIKSSPYVGNSDKLNCSKSNLLDSCKYRLTTVCRSSSETRGEFKLSKGTLAEYLSTENTDTPTWCNKNCSTIFGARLLAAFRQNHSCRAWGFHSGDYEECHLLWCGAVWIL
jgi:hypothetical protein